MHINYLCNPLYLTFLAMQCMNFVVFAATEISRRVLPIKALFQIMTNVIAAMLGNT